MSEFRIFRRGLPYGPDIKKLSEEFPPSALSEGTVIAHDRLTSILQLKKGIPRYYAVVNSWIKHERNTNGIFIIWETNVGLKVLGPAEILDYGETGIRQKSTQLVRKIRILDYVDSTRLNETGQARTLHDRRVNMRTLEALSAAKKELAVELSPVKSLPKRQIKAGAE